MSLASEQSLTPPGCCLQHEQQLSFPSVLFSLAVPHVNMGSQQGSGVEIEQFAHKQILHSFFAMSVSTCWVYRTLSSWSTDLYSFVL